MVFVGKKKKIQIICYHTGTSTGFVSHNQSEL